MSWLHYVALSCRFSIGSVFAVSVATKVRSHAAWVSFRSWLTALPLRPARLSATPAAIAAAEVTIVTLVAAPPPAAAGLAVAAAFSLVLVIGLSLAIRRGSRQPCHCFGSSLEPLSYQHVARNIALLAIALAGVAASRAPSAGISGLPEVALAAIGGLASAVIIIFFADFLALLRPGIGLQRQEGAR